MSGHSEGPWVLSPWTGEDGGSGWGIGLHADQWLNIGAASDHSEANARLIAAAPRVSDALFNLLVVLGQAGLTPEQHAVVGAACDEASAALIESGRVMG